VGYDSTTLLVFSSFAILFASYSSAILFASNLVVSSAAIFLASNI